MKSDAEILVFGATHAGIRLAERLTGEGHPVTIIDPAPRPEGATAWWRVCADYTLPDGVGAARVVYLVTDEDKLNIRLALAVRRASATVPIVMMLTQSPLGEKLARHLGNFAFVNGPALAAGYFVDAIYAARPAGAELTPVAEAPPPPADEARERWHLDPLVARAIGVILAIGVLATCYFHVAEHLRWVDSLYFVVTMMATVGFGDISLKDSSTLSKLVGVAVMIASVANTAVIFALITDSLLKKRLVLSFGKRRIRQKGHIIVAGVGSVGLRVVERLRERGETVVVIDNHEGGRYLSAIYAKRLPAILGDARATRTLRDAGIADAKALLSVTNDDLTNLETGLNAKLLHPGLRVVLRIFDQDLATSLREQLDIHFAYSMSAIAAEQLAKFAAAPPRATAMASAASGSTQPPTRGQSQTQTQTQAQSHK